MSRVEGLPVPTSAETSRKLVQMVPGREAAYTMRGAQAAHISLSHMIEAIACK